MGRGRSEVRRILVCLALPKGYLPFPHAWQVFKIDRPGWHPYLARVNGVPAGVSMLDARNDTAYLTLTSTIPAFRKLGCPSALLRQRIADAPALGYDLLTSSAAFDSASQHNLERAGLRIAYTLASRQPLPGATP